MIREEGRARRHVVEHERARHHRHDGVRGNAEREERNEARLRARVVRGFGAGDTPKVSFAHGHFVGALGELLFERIAREGGKKRAAARQSAEHGPEDGPAKRRPRDGTQLFTAGPKRSGSRCDVAASFGVGHVHDDVGDAVDPHREDREVESFLERETSEGVAKRSRLQVRADEARKKSGERHREGPKETPLGEHHRAREAEDHEGAVVGGAEQKGGFGQKRRKEGERGGGEGASEKARDRGGGEGRRGAARPRETVAVETGDDGARLARKVQKNRRGAPSVLSAVVNPREHDDGARGFERVGEGKEHGDRRHGTKSGQHAHECAEEDARRGVAEVRDREGRRKAESERLKHDRLLQRSP